MITDPILILFKKFGGVSFMHTFRLSIGTYKQLLTTKKVVKYICVIFQSVDNLLLKVISYSYDHKLDGRMV